MIDRRTRASLDETAEKDDRHVSGNEGTHLGVVAHTYLRSPNLARHPSLRSSCPVKPEEALGGVVANTRFRAAENVSSRVESEHRGEEYLQMKIVIAYIDPLVGCQGQQDSSLSLFTENLL